MRLYACLMFGALVSSIALVPLAALADDGLTVLVFVTPEGRDIGQSVDVNVEAYMWGTPVDLETLDAMVTYGGTAIAMANVSTGKWHGTHTIGASEALYGAISISVSGDYSGLTAAEFLSYQLPSAGTASAWVVQARTANLEQFGLTPPPGTNVVIEGRSYFNGALKDGGQLNASARWSSGATSTTDNLTSTKIADGIYQFTVAVPADVTVGRSYLVTVKLGSGTGATTDYEAFMVNPVPVAAWIASSTQTSASVRVLAGSTGPLAGATVQVSGEVVTYSPYGTSSIAPASGTTDAKGQATVNVTWTGSGAATLRVNVTSGGKTSSLLLYAYGDLGLSTWIPQPNFPFGCSAALQTDDSSFKAGQTAELKVRVTEGGTLLASKSLARFVYRSGAAASAQAGNVTTDAQGNFTVSYAVPADWKDTDALTILVVCPTGVSDTVTASFEPAGPGGVSNIHVIVGSAAAGGMLPVAVTYSGNSTLAGVVAGAILIPGGRSSGLESAIGGNAPYVVLVRSGTTFTGQIQIPSFYPEGDYSVLVGLTSSGAVSVLSDAVSESNVTVVHIGAAGSAAGGGLLPGFEAPLVAAAVGLAGIGATRRRRVSP